MKKPFKKLGQFIITKDKKPEVIDKIGEYDKSKVIVSPGESGGSA